MPDLFRHPPLFQVQHMRERAPCVYILASAHNGTLYTGVTSDLAGRLYLHREGVTGGFAGGHKALRLVYFEMHETMETAIRREKSIKRWRREWKMNLIERDNPHWADLALSLGFEPLAVGSSSTVDAGTSPA